MNVILDGGSHERHSGQGLVYEGDFDTDWLLRDKDVSRSDLKSLQQEVKNIIKKQG